jgi:hypothetical protein
MVIMVEIWILVSFVRIVKVRFILGLCWLRLIGFLLLVNVLTEVESGVIVGILFMLDLVFKHFPVLHQ